MKAILVPTDFSKNAKNAVKYAFGYAKDLKLPVVLFHAYDNPAADVTVPFYNVRYTRTEARQNAETAVKKLSRALSKVFPEVKHSTVVRPGNALVNICEYAKVNKIHTIIMGTTGQGAIARVLIGSTTEGVIASEVASVIAVPPAARYKGVRKISAGLEYEDKSPLIVEEPVKLAKKFKAELQFVHVQELSLPVADIYFDSLIANTKKQMRYSHISFKVLDDTSILKGIEKYLKRYKPDILTIFTHNRKFPDTIWHASWTSRMLNHIPVPMLVLPAKKTKK